MSVKLIRFSAAARYCEVSPPTFRRWVRAGLVPVLVDPETGTKWFATASLDKWLLEFTAPTDVPKAS